MKFSCPKDVKLPVYILFILFGMGSWIAVNGLWVELPILVHEAPEGWNLPSYITILVQIANIGPLLYTVINRLIPKYFNEKHGIIIIVVLGAAASLMLVFLWKETAYIAGAERSVGLLVCVFLLSFVDTTSTVVFLAYMAYFSPRYVSAMFIGNGMSGLVPAVVALAQNVGETLCLNKTVNSTTNETAIFAEYVQPNFPVEDFFYFLFAIMVLCGICFGLLQYLPYCKSEHINQDTSYEIKENGLKSNSLKGDNESVTVISVSNVSLKGENEKQGISYSSETFSTPVNHNGNVQLENPKTYSTLTDIKDTNGEPTVETNSETKEEIKSLSDEHKPLPLRDYAVMLLITAVINGMKNGVVPSISSYSTLPYGDTVFLLAATLMSIVDPLACVVAFFLPVSSIRAISVVAVGSGGLAAYIVAIAAYSPVPPMVGETIGGVLIVSVGACYNCCY